MRSAVAYIRVSRADKKRGLTLDLQLKEITAYAERSGVALVETYVDEGKSAYTNRIDKRPAFQRLLREAQGKGRPWSLVLVYKTDRFARDALLQLQCRRDLLKLGVRTESATQHNPDDSAIGKLNVVLDAGLNEYYSALLSDRMRDVRRFEASAQGRHVGPVPVGYDRRDGRLIANDRAAVVLLAGQLYATGQHSAARIADALNAAGHTNAEGEPFKVYAVEEMLKNPIYVGRVRCDGHEYAGAHERLVDDATWAAVQAEIARRGGGNHGQRAASRPAMLSGLARCSNCGAPMWYMPLRGRGVSYYVCSGRATRARAVRCNLGFVQARAAEAHVIDSLGALTADANLMAAVADELDQLAQQARQQLPQPPVDRGRLEARQRRLQRLYLDGALDESEYDRERLTIRAQLDALDAPLALPLIPDVRQAAAYLADIPALLRAAEPHDARAVLAEVFSVVYLMPHGAMAARPTAAVAPLLAGLWLKSNLEWAGWAPDTRPLHFNDRPLMIMG